MTTETIEIWTAGDPIAAVGRAFSGLEPGVFHAAVEHDKGCPVMVGREPLRACTCPVVRLKVRRRRGAA